MHICVRVHIYAYAYTCVVEKRSQSFPRYHNSQGNPWALLTNFSDVDGFGTTEKSSDFDECVKICKIKQLLFVKFDRMCHTRQHVQDT